MRKTLLLFIGVTLVTPTLAFAAAVPDQNAAKDLGNTIMAKVAAGDIDAAFKIMKPYVPISGTEVEAAAMQTKTAMEQFGARYGTPISYEFIDSKQIGDSLLRLRYIEKTDKHAIPWIFYFYKTKEGWTLNSFDWKDTFKELFQLN